MGAVPPCGCGRTEHATSGRTRRRRGAGLAGPSRARARTTTTAGPRPSRASSTTAGEAIAALSKRYTLPPEIAADIRNAADVATALQKERLVERAESAYGAYERGRYQDALRAIKPVAEVAPAVAAVRELAGLAAYRSGRWREATRHLQAFGALSDSTEHLPVLMDCQRALHKPKKVAELWSELRQSSPDPDVLAEGRIVAVGVPRRHGRPERRHLDAGDRGRGEGVAESLRPPRPAVVPAGRPVRACR